MQAFKVEYIGGDLEGEVFATLGFSEGRSFELERDATEEELEIIKLLLEPEDIDCLTCHSDIYFPAEDVLCLELSE